MHGFTDMLRSWAKNCSAHFNWYMDKIAVGWHMHRVMYYALWLVATLQLVGFGAGEEVAFEWSTDITRLMMRICRAISHFPNPRNNMTPYAASIAIAVGIFFLWIITSLMLRFLGWVKPTSLLRFLLMVISSIFVVPIGNGLLSMPLGCIGVGNGDPHIFYATVACGSSSFYAAAVFGAVIAVIFFVFMALVGIMCFEPAIPVALNARTAVTAQISGFHTALYALTILILCIFSGVSRSHAWRWPLSVVTFVLGVFVSQKEVIRLPRYADDAQVLGLIQAYGLTWTGLCALITTALNVHDSDQGMSMLLYVGFPVIAIAAAVTVRTRYANMAHARTRDLTSPRDFILHARALLWHWHGQVHIVGYDHYLEETPELIARRRDVLRDVETSLHLGVDRFPRSAELHNFLARFLMEVQDNRVLAYGELQSSEECRPTPSVRFSNYRLRLTLDALTTASQSAEVQLYLEFKSSKELADAAIVGASRLLVEFWTELLKPAPDIDTLAQVSHAARILLARGTQHYDKLLQINPSSVPVLRTYGAIVLDLLGDTAKALSMFERAETIELQRAKQQQDTMQRGDFLQRLESNLDIFDERNAVFGISVDKHKLGIIESVNPAAKRMFGFFNTSDLVGKSINLIVPSPIAELHDQILSDYLIRKTSRIVDQTRVAYARHRQGFIFPVNLYVRWADEANAKMVGVLQAIDHPRDVHFLVDPERSRIRSTTANCNSFFGLRRSQMLESCVTLPQLMPDLQLRDDDPDASERCWSQIATRSGLIGRAQNFTTGRTFPTRAWLISMTVLGATVWFVRVLVYDHDDEEDDEEAELGSEESFATTQRDRHEDDEEHANRTSLLAGLVEDDDSHDNDDSNSLIGRIIGPAHSAPNTQGDNHASLRKHPSSLALGATASNMGNGNAGPSVPTPSHAAQRIAQAQRQAAKLSRSIDVAENPGTEFAGLASVMETPDVALRRRREAARRQNSQMTGMPPAGRSGVRGGAIGGGGEDDSNSSAESDDGLGLRDKKTKTFGQRRLMRAIEQENKKTSRGIRRMSTFSHVLVYYIIACAVAAYIITTSYMDRSASQAHDILQSANRNAIVIDNNGAMRRLSLVNAQSWPVFDEVDAPAGSQMGVFNAIKARISADTQMLRTYSRQIDWSSALGSTQQSLRNDAALPLHIKLGGTIVSMLYSLKDAFQTYIALVDLSVIASTSLGAMDISEPYAFYAMANGLEEMRRSSQRNTLLLRENMVHNHDVLLIVTVMLYVASVLGFLLVMFFCIRPIVLRVEESKSHVLDMFLDIKRPVRRALRRQIHSVFMMMKSDAEDEAQIDDDDAEAAQAEGDGSDAEERAAAAAVARATQEGANRGDVARAQSGTAHSRYLMRIARNRAAKRYALAAETAAAESRDDGTVETLVAKERERAPSKHARARASGAQSAIDAYLGAFDGDDTGSNGTDIDMDGGGSLPGSVGSGEAPATKSLIDDDPYTRQIRQMADNGDGGELTVNLSSLANATKAAIQRSNAEDKGANRKLSKEEKAKLKEARKHLKNKDLASAERSLLARQALRALFIRFALFIGYIIGYGVMMSVLTHQTDVFIEHFSATIDFSARRLPALQRSLFYTRENLFAKFEDVVASDPVFPTTLGGQFLDIGRATLNETQMLNHAILFGNTSYGLVKPVSFEEQETLYFVDACDFPSDDRAAAYMVAPISQYYVNNCGTVENGIMKLGLNQAQLFAFNQLDALLIEEYSGLFGPWQGYAELPAYPVGSAQFNSIASRLQVLSEFINNYLGVAFSRSSSVYLVQILNKIESFNSLRLILIIMFSLILMMLYVFGFRPVARGLEVAARQTRAMMLILPPDVVKSIPSVQAFILNNHRGRE